MANKPCKSCGAPDLHWIQSEPKKWQLVNDKGERHTCPNYARADTSKSAWKPRFNSTVNAELLKAISDLTKEVVELRKTFQVRELDLFNQR